MVESDLDRVRQSDLDQVRQETLQQIPDFALPEEERQRLAEGKARMEVFGEDPDEAYFALLDKAAVGIEEGYAERYISAGVPEAVAATASGAQRQQFLGQELSPPEIENLEIAEGIAEAKRKEYGRVINGLKEQYGQEVGAYGSPDLMQAAAQIRTREQVYGQEPTERQGRLLKAADLQRRKGIGKQLQWDYEASGVPSRIAQAAGSSKAQESVFGAELSEAQQQRVTQADGYLTSVKGQLGRNQQRQFMDAQVSSAYQQGRLTQALEDAGVDPGLAEQAARIEVSSGGEPQSEQDEAILAQAYASAGQGDALAADIAANAEQFMNVASEAGITASVGDADIAQGHNYTLTRTGAITVIQNRETGGSLVAQGGTPLAAEGMDAADQERFQRLGQLSPADLQGAVQQGQPQPSSQRQQSEEMEVA